MVDQLKCEVDPQHTYIRKKYRHLVEKIKEHNNKLCAIFDHRVNCSCRCSPNNFKNASGNFSFNIKESLHIKQLQPTLNRTRKDFYSCHSLYICCNNFLLLSGRINNFVEQQQFDHWKLYDSIFKNH